MNNEFAILVLYNKVDAMSWIDDVRSLIANCDTTYTVFERYPSLEFYIEEGHRWTSGGVKVPAATVMCRITDEKELLTMRLTESNISWFNRKVYYDAHNLRERFWVAEENNE